MKKKKKGGVGWGRGTDKYENVNKRRTRPVCIIISIIIRMGTQLL